MDKEYIFYTLISEASKNIDSPDKLKAFMLKAISIAYESDCDMMNVLADLKPLCIELHICYRCGDDENVRNGICPGCREPDDDYDLT